MTVCILGAGAFGTALAIALSETNNIHLWGRNAEGMAEVRATRKSSMLPGAILVQISRSHQTPKQLFKTLISS